MSRVTLRNRKSISEREREVKEQIKQKYGDEDLEFTKTDILAMIIAAFQVILPLVIGAAVIFFLVVLIFTKVYLKG